MKRRATRSSRWWNRLPSNVRARALALAFCALASSGCGNNKKINECNVLVGVINDAVQKIRTHASNDPDGGNNMQQLRLLADEMEVVAVEAEKAELSFPELRKFADEYQQMAKEVAASAHELATAYDKVDIEGITKAQTRMDKAVKREDPLVEALNNYCRVQ